MITYASCWLSRRVADGRTRTHSPDSQSTLAACADVPIRLERHDEVLLGHGIHIELSSGALRVGLGRKTERLRSAGTPPILTSASTLGSAPVEPRPVGEAHNDRPASRIRHCATLARGPDAVRAPRQDRHSGHRAPSAPETTVDFRADLTITSGTLRSATETPPTNPKSAPAAVAWP